MRSVLAFLLLFPLTARAEVEVSSRLPDLTGYLGMATVTTAENKRYWWSPVARGAAVAIVTQEFPPLAPRSWVGTAPGFREPVSLDAVREEPYGCDDVPTPMALLKSAKRPPEGPVLVVPASDEVTAVALESLVPKKRPAWLSQLSANPKEAQVWQIGNHHLVMQKQSAFGYRLALFEKGREIYRQDGKKAFPFEGAEHTPVDLSSTEPEVPKPLMAYRVAGRDKPSVVLFHAGYEGLGFSILWPRNGQMQETYVNSIYWCAF